MGLAIYWYTAMRAVTSYEKIFIQQPANPRESALRPGQPGYLGDLPLQGGRFVPLYNLSVYTNRLTAPQVNAGRSDIAIELPEGSGWDGNVLARATIGPAGAPGQDGDLIERESLMASARREHTALRAGAA